MLDNKPLYDDTALAYIKFKNSQVPVQPTQQVPLTEDLNDKEKAKTEDWDHFSEVNSQTRDKVEKALGDRNGYGKTIVPLSHQEVPEDPDVAGHLANHGWKIHNYLEGTAHTTKMVGNPEKGIPMQEKTIKSSIGKVLQSTNAPEHIKNAFANDPVRAAAKSAPSDLRVMISTHPHSIGGMSTGTTWESCMNMTDGCNRGYLPKESESGTHVAFLVHKDDHGANHGTVPTAPLARIALKPYHDENSDVRDTIFRPERRTYGNAGTAFESTVDKWAKDNYPAKEGSEYHKNKESYDDTGNTTFKSLSKEDVHGMLAKDRRPSNVGNEVDDATVGHAMSYGRENKLSSGDYSAYLNNIVKLPLKASHVAELIKNIPKPVGGETDGQLERISDHGDYSFHMLAEHHGGKFTSGHIEEYRNKINNGQFKALDSTLASAVLGNPRLPEHIAANLTPEHYHKLHPSKMNDERLGKLVENVKSATPEKEGTAWGDVSRNMSRFKDKHLSEIAKVPSLEKYVESIPKIFAHPNSSAETKSTLTDRFFHQTKAAGRYTRMHSDQITPEHVNSIRHEIDSDGEHHPIHARLSDVTHNKRISDDTAIAAKNKFMEIDPKDMSHYYGMTNLPDRLTSKFTDSDIDKFVNDRTGSEVARHLAPAEFNNRVLDNIEGKIKTAHATSQEMVAANKKNTPEFGQLEWHTNRLLEKHANMVYRHIEHHLSPDMSEQADINNFDATDAKRQMKRFKFISNIKKTTPHSYLNKEDFGHSDSEDALRDSIDSVEYDRKENA